MGRRSFIDSAERAACGLGRAPASDLSVPLSRPRSHLQLLTPVGREMELGLRSRPCRIGPQSSRSGVSAFRCFPPLRRREVGVCDELTRSSERLSGHHSRTFQRRADTSSHVSQTRRNT